MIQLPDNCRAGNFNIYPENWNLKNADPTLTWKISFWFYDDKTGKRKLVRLSDVNRYSALREKQKAFKKLLDDTLIDLQHRNWNPITDDILDNDADIVTIKTALRTALTKIKVVHSYHLVIKSMLKYVFISIDRLKYDSLPIENITRLHIKQIFEDLPKHKTTFSAYTHNSYRKDLHLLFEQIVDDELLEHNPVTKLKRQKATTPIRRQLTIEEWERINKHLRKNYPEFWRFTVIFLLSGSRITEMLAIHKEDINLYDQEFNVTVKKGKTESGEPRVIRNEILEHWKYLYNLAKPGEYIFSKGLLPGPKQIRRDQITRRWEEHVKKKLNIPADIYSLKHSNLTDIAEKINIVLASKAGGHVSPDTTSKYYVQGQKKREHEILKSIPSKFSLN